MRSARSEEKPDDQKRLADAAGGKLCILEAIASMFTTPGIDLVKFDDYIPCKAKALKPIATLIRPFSSTLVPMHQNQSLCIRFFFRGLEKRLAGSSPGIHALPIPFLWIPGFCQARALAPAIPLFC